jgi:hypothetical protein
VAADGGRAVGEEDMPDTSATPDAAGHDAQPPPAQADLLNIVESS